MEFLVNEKIINFKEDGIFLPTANRPVGFYSRKRGEVEVQSLASALFLLEEERALRWIFHVFKLNGKWEIDARAYHAKDTVGFCSLCGNPNAAACAAFEGNEAFFRGLMRAPRFRLFAVLRLRPMRG